MNIAITQHKLMSSAASNVNLAGNLLCSQTTVRIALMLKLLLPDGRAIRFRTFIFVKHPLICFTNFIFYSLLKFPVDKEWNRV